jgi:hypothetical protein
MNEPNKLQSNNTLLWQGLLVTKILAYRGHSYVKKETKCCEYRPMLLFLRRKNGKI